jgi:23S rRNA (uracil1939-C5)-methyltransferase
VEGNNHWKQGILADAFARAGFGEDRIARLIAISPGARRRATFSYLRLRNDTILGFSKRSSHDLIDVRACPVLVPALQTVLPSLRGALRDTLPTRANGRVTATLTLSGLDVLIESKFPLDLTQRERLAAFAETADLACLSWSAADGAPEPVARRRQPYVRFGDVLVEPPPGGFLQPSEEGEKALVALVTEAVGDAASVLDLYAGCGTLTFPLAKRAKVRAVEGRKDAIEALRQAAHRAQIILETEQRDLAQRPIAGAEFDRYQALVFDPPHAGAADQAKAIASHGPPIVVAVSCNPATLARDGGILAQGGYRLVRATPLDQFPWSARLEAVAVFKR